MKLLEKKFSNFDDVIPWQINNIKTIQNFHKFIVPFFLCRPLQLDLKDSVVLLKALLQKTKKMKLYLFSFCCQGTRTQHVCEI